MDLEREREREAGYIHSPRAFARRFGALSRDQTLCRVLCGTLWSAFGRALAVVEKQCTCFRLCVFRRRLCVRPRCSKLSIIFCRKASWRNKTRKSRERAALPDVLPVEFASAVEDASFGGPKNGSQNALPNVRKFESAKRGRVSRGTLSLSLSLSLRNARTRASFRVL